MSGGTFYPRVGCPGGHSTRGDSLVRSDTVRIESKYNQVALEVHLF